MKAVILAGGLGSRLQPLSKIMPKALAPINGIPILEQQIHQLINLGIEEVLILTGYKASMVEQYLLYMKFEKSIKCIETPEGFTPAERLLFSEREIGQDFLLLYCDNLISDDKNIRRVIASDNPITFLMERRHIGNVLSEEDAKYFAHRTVETPFVELGYMHILDPRFFTKLTDTASLPKTLHELSHEGNARGIITASSLQSVSRMSNFNNLRKNRKTILLDRDGIINYKMPKRKYVSNWGEFRLIEENIKVLNEKYSKNTDFIVITNQPGVATKEVDVDFLESLHSKMIIELLRRGISIIGLYVCPHHWEENCVCRKPKPGMILQAIADYDLDGNKIVFIGDEQKDTDAAKNAGIHGLRISAELDTDAFRNLSEAYPAVSEITGW